MKTDGKECNEPFFDKPLIYWEKGILTHEFDIKEGDEILHVTTRRDNE